MKKWLIGLLIPQLIVWSDGVRIKVDAHETRAVARRADLMGINVSVYNNAEVFESVMKGPIRELEVGLIRMPGGTQSDRFYWNGNGVVSNGQVNAAKFKDGYWEVDYSHYAPGFVVDAADWSKADPGFVQLDARTMHEITRAHPSARNLVTVNVGTGTPEMAAEWVRWANISNDYQVKYWELGNELNGEWEPGHIMRDGSIITAEIYAQRYIEFAKAMKMVDPTIRVGGPSCDVEHGDEYFEVLLRDAGEYVDFLSLHYYSLRDSLASEEQLFDGLENMAPLMEQYTGLVEKYLPERAEEIEFSITEWNSKLPKDQDACRLFNGLWFSAWIGEMIKAGVDSATVWDMFSGADNGHGVLVRRDGEYVPTGRYWAFWLWSNYMADTLVKSSVDPNEHLHVYATCNDQSLYVMVMNESRTETYPVTLDIEGFNASGSGKEITLSSREYFWNPRKGQADWNTGPFVVLRRCIDGMQAEVPPYCVKIYQFDAVENPLDPVPVIEPGKPELQILMAESGPGDMPIEGWVRAFKAGTDLPYGGDLEGVQLELEGNAALGSSSLVLAGAAGRFMLTPKGPGSVTLKAQYQDVIAEKTVRFDAVDLQSHVVWNFDSGVMEQSTTSRYGYEIVPIPGSTNRAVCIRFDPATDQKPGDHILNIGKFPKGIPLERIGGIVFDLFIPAPFKVEDPDANLQFVLQSHGAYWIPCGQILLSEVIGKRKTLQMEVIDKKQLQVMNQAFAMIFQVAFDTSAEGTLYLDNIGFILRPEQ